MASEGRIITRTRPSFTCVPCKRKKIRCSKEKPTCTQCNRTGSACFYESISPFDVTVPDQIAKRQKTTSSDIQEREHIIQRPTAGFPSTILTHIWDQTSNDQTSLTSQLTPEEGLGETYALDEAFTAFMNTNSQTINSHRDSLEGFYVSPDLSSASASAPSQRYNGPSAQQSTPVSPSRQLSEDDEALNDTLAGDQDTSSHRDCTDDWDILGVTEFDDEKMLTPYTYIPKEYKLQRQVASGYLSKAPHMVPRYIEDPFRTKGSNQEAACNLILQCHLSQYHPKRLQDRQYSELSTLMQSLPPQKICDVLLRSFLTGVRPLLPLVHVPSLLRRYESFWTRNAHGRASSFQFSPTSRTSEQAFCCLLWAVLFCGAVAASPALLSEAAVRANNRIAFLSRLRSKVNKSLDLCRQDRLPTLDGLIASLLAQECDLSVDPIIDMPPFISRSIHAAMTLGLHREAALSEFPDSEAEMGRRVWHHLLDLEVTAFFEPGNSLHLISSKATYDTRLPGEQGDAALAMGSKDHCQKAPAPHSSTANTSSAMILARGQHETSRMLRRVIDTCYSGHQSPEVTELKRLASEMEEFDRKIDGLIRRLAVRGIPECGQISSQLLGANPLVHSGLYVDNPREPTVLNAFCRIRLNMMKFNVSTLFNRQFLNHSRHAKFPGIWNSQFSNCVQSLRNYLHLAKLPAFTPYQWYCPGKLNVSQECMVILSFLQESCRSDGKRHQLLYLLSEVFDMFQLHMAEADHGMESELAEDELDTMPARRATWRALKQLYDEVLSKTGIGDEEVSRLPLSPSEKPTAKGPSDFRHDLDKDQLHATSWATHLDDSQSTLLASPDPSNRQPNRSGPRPRRCFMANTDALPASALDLGALALPAQDKEPVIPKRALDLESYDWADIIETG